jgi:hypothetical protein
MGAKHPRGPGRPGSSRPRWWGYRRDRVLAIPRTPLRKPPSALGFEIFDRGPSSIRDFFVLNGLPLFQSSQAGLFESRDVNENVKPNPFFRLNHFTCRAPLLVSRVEGLHSLRFVGNPTVNEEGPVRR